MAAPLPVGVPPISPWALPTALPAPPALPPHRVLVPVLPGHRGPRVPPVHRTTYNIALTPLAPVRHLDTLYPLLLFFITFIRLEKTV